VRIYMRPPALNGGPGAYFPSNHPIGFDYQSFVNVDNEINPVTAPVVGTLNGGPSTIEELLRNGRMECVTCHDVHNFKNGGPKFTWVNDAGSRLCLTCHRKNE
jgi:predicted CXXCH cytochrome family protein